MTSVTVSRRVQESVGAMRDFEKHVALDVPNVMIRVPQVDVGPFRTWFHDFVVKGHNDDSLVRTASLAFLDPSRTTELLRIELGGVGIVRIAQERREAGVELGSCGSRPAAGSRHGPHVEHP